MNLAQFVVAVYFCCLAHGRISCRDATGKAVDWFVGYKLPTFNSGRSSEPGTAFYYVDSTTTSWGMPEMINSSDCSVAVTFKQLYETASNTEEIFYMLYNDEHPDTRKVDNSRAHAKGLAVFDSQSGFWLIHSVPSFPPMRNDRFSYPEWGLRNGQSFLCITLATDSLGLFAKQMMYMQPSVYDSQLPTTIATRFPELQAVITKKSLPKNSTKYYSIQAINSFERTEFWSFAKHKRFRKDLYSQLVSPNLKVSLLTETWMNGPGDLPSYCESPYKVKNVRSVRVAGRLFTSSKDHSKWALAENPAKPFLCIGDINRQKKQKERGGGTVCLSHRALWQLFNSSVVEIEECKSEMSRKAKAHESSSFFASLWQKIKELFGW